MQHLSRLALAVSPHAARPLRPRISCLAAHWTQSRAATLRTARPLSAAAAKHGNGAAPQDVPLAKGALVCFERDDKRPVLVLLTRPDGKTRWFGTDAVSLDAASAQVPKTRPDNQPSPRC